VDVALVVVDIGSLQIGKLPFAGRKQFLRLPTSPLTFGPHHDVDVWRKRGRLEATTVTAGSLWPNSQLLSPSAKRTTDDRPDHWGYRISIGADARAPKYLRGVEEFDAACWRQYASVAKAR